MNHEADADCCQQPASFNKPVYTLPRSKCPSIYAQFLLQLQICKLLLEENLHLGQQCVVPENIYNFLLHWRVVSKDPLHPTNLLVSLLPPPRNSSPFCWGGGEEWIFSGTAQSAFLATHKYIIVTSKLRSLSRI